MQPERFWGFGLRRYVGKDSVTFVTPICPVHCAVQEQKRPIGRSHRTKNRLSIFAIVGKVPCIWPGPSCSSFAMAGALIPVVKSNGKKTATQRFLRKHRFTTSSTGIIRAL